MTSLLRYLRFDFKRNKKLLIIFLILLVAIYILSNILSVKLALDYYRTLDFSNISKVELRTSMFNSLVDMSESLGLLIFTLIFTIALTNQRVNTEQDTTSYNMLQLPLPKYTHILIVYLETGLFLLINYLMIVIISYTRGSYLLSKFRLYSLEYGIPINNKVDMLDILSEIFRYNPIFHHSRLDLIMGGWFVIIGISCLASILFTKRLNVGIIRASLILVAFYFITYMMISFIDRYQIENPITLLISGLILISINTYLIKNIDY